MLTLITSTRAEDEVNSSDTSTLTLTKRKPQNEKDVPPEHQRYMTLEQKKNRSRMYAPVVPETMQNQLPVVKRQDDSDSGGIEPALPRLKSISSLDGSVKPSDSKSKSDSGGYPKLGHITSFIEGSKKSQSKKANNENTEPTSPENSPGRAQDNEEPVEQKTMPIRTLKRGSIPVLNRKAIKFISETPDSDNNITPKTHYSSPAGQTDGVTPKRPKVKPTIKILK